MPKRTAGDSEGRLDAVKRREELREELRLLTNRALAAKLEVTPRQVDYIIREGGFAHLVRDYDMRQQQSTVNQ